MCVEKALDRRCALLQVLDTLAYAERELLEAMPAFKHASVLVHLQSDVEVRADPCWLDSDPTAGPRHVLMLRGCYRAMLPSAWVLVTCW